MNFMGNGTKRTEDSGHYTPVQEMRDRARVNTRFESENQTRLNALARGDNLTYAKLCDKLGIVEDMYAYESGLAELAFMRTKESGLGKVVEEGSGEIGKRESSEVVQNPQPDYAALVKVLDNFPFSRNARGYLPASQLRRVLSRLRGAGADIPVYSGLSSRQVFGLYKCVEREIRDKAQAAAQAAQAGRQ